MARSSDAAIGNRQSPSKVLEEAKIATSLQTIADAMNQMRIIKAKASTNGDAKLGEAVTDRIRNYLSLRSRAKAVFGGSLLFDPAWDILLTLYINHVDGRQTDIKALIATAETPHATTTRWTQELVRQKLIFRNVDTSDRRRVIVKLTARAVEVIEMVWLPGEVLPDLPPSC